MRRRIDFDRYCHSTVASNVTGAGLIAEHSIPVEIVTIGDFAKPSPQRKLFQRSPAVVR